MCFYSIHTLNRFLIIGFTSGQSSIIESYCIGCIFHLLHGKCFLSRSKQIHIHFISKAQLPREHKCFFDSLYIYFIVHKCLKLVCKPMCLYDCMYVCMYVSVYVSVYVCVQCNDFVIFNVFFTRSIRPLPGR